MNRAARSQRRRPEGLASRLAGKAKSAWTDQRGVAAIEFGIFFILLTVSIANVADVSKYIYQRMQVENATEVAVQAALKKCGTQLPATTNCSALLGSMQAAMQSTSLGAGVQLANGSPTEGYYCIDSSGALEYVSDVSSRPADCTAAGMPTLQPGDYIQIQTTFTYQPWFPGISVASTFPTLINRTAIIRLG